MMMNQKDVWGKIAEPWQQCRQEPLKEVEEFLKNKNGKILDVGCGSGRHFVKTDGTFYGIDFSERMLELAKEEAKRRGANAVLKQADVTKIPFEKDFFDAALCIAVLHCLGKDKRLECLDEIKRMLKPGCEALISVWHKDEKGDRLVPWKVGNKTVERFYHFFSQQELEDEIEQAGFVSRTWIAGGREKNIFAVAKKPF